MKISKHNRKELKKAVFNMLRYGTRGVRVCVPVFQSSKPICINVNKIVNFVYQDFVMKLDKLQVKNKKKNE